MTEAGGYRFFAGWRSDPFFFRHAGGVERSAVHRRRFLHRQGRVEHRAGSAQAPLGPKRVARARTLDGAGGVCVQADRGALPAQAVFVVRSERDGDHASGTGEPRPSHHPPAHALEHTGGYAPEEARRVAGTLLPDMPSGRPDASRVLSEHWPYAHRRRRRRFPGSPHKREGDRGQGRAPHRSACRVPLFGAAAQYLCVELCSLPIAAEVRVRSGPLGPTRGPSIYLLLTERRLTKVSEICALDEEFGLGGLAAHMRAQGAYVENCLVDS